MSDPFRSHFGWSIMERGVVISHQSSETSSAPSSCAWAGLRLGIDTQHLETQRRRRRHPRPDAAEPDDADDLLAGRRPADTRRQPPTPGPHRGSSAGEAAGQPQRHRQRVRHDLLHAVVGRVGHRHAAPVAAGMSIMSIPIPRRLINRHPGAASSTARGHRGPLHDERVGGPAAPRSRSSSLVACGARRRGPPRAGALVLGSELGVGDGHRRRRGLALAPVRVTGRPPALRSPDVPSIAPWPPAGRRRDASSSSCGFRVGAQALRLERRCRGAVEAGDPAPQLGRHLHQQRVVGEPPETSWNAGRAATSAGVSLAGGGPSRPRARGARRRRPASRRLDARATSPSSTPGGSTSPRAGSARAGHPRATPGRALHQALLLEPGQRLAQRDVADAEQGREAALDEAVTRGIDPALMPPGAGPRRRRRGCGRAGALRAHVLTLTHPTRLNAITNSGVPKIRPG